MAQRLEAEGNIKDTQKWDDGSDYEDVTKIYVRGDRDGIQSIKFDYVKTGQLKDGSFHGFSTQGFTQMFEIDHLKGEQLVSVEGYHNGEVIQGLQFKTNLKVSEVIGYVSIVKFTLAVEGKKIIGFHGSAKSNLTSLGAYVTWITPIRMEATGVVHADYKVWDDGGYHKAVTKISVCAGEKGIINIKFDYIDNDGHPKEGLVHGNPHGDGGVPLEPFEISYVDNEYLLSIEFRWNHKGILAIRFKTNMKTSELMGFISGHISSMNALECNGNKFIGFHGHESEENLKSLGVYFPTPVPMVKLESKGDSGGFPWDDGTFHGVRKVCVYYDADCMRCVRFEYDNSGRLETREHGTKYVDKIQEGEFVLDYPNELLTSVEGTIQNRQWITSMTFKTSKGRTSPKFGYDQFDTGVIEFKLEKKDCAIVGFHGRSIFDGLKALGAYCFPMAPPHDGDN